MQGTKLWNEDLSTFVFNSSVDRLCLNVNKGVILDNSYVCMR